MLHRSKNFKIFSEKFKRVSRFLILDPSLKLARSPLLQSFSPNQREPVFLKNLANRIKLTGENPCQQKRSPGTHDGCNLFRLSSKEIVGKIGGHQVRFLKSRHCNPNQVCLSKT